MSIEIKQMIIKSTLVDERRNKLHSEYENFDIEEIKQQLMEACREMIEQNLIESQER
jgi:hypothetical protein